MTLPECRASTTEMKPVWRATSDPYNRGTYPWGREDKALLDWHKKLVWLRKDYDVIREGDFDPFSIGDDVLGFRTRTAREEIIVCANRNRFEDIQIGLPVRVPGAGSHRPSDGVTDVKGSEPSGGRAGILVLELLSGEKVTPDSQVIRSTLKPLEGKVFYILHRESRPATTPFSERSCGILLHVTSLPSRWGIGDMGKDAYRFVDFLAESGQRLWQILPLNPVGPGNAPYRSPSAMAGNPLLISPDLMLEEGLLTQEEVRKELDRLSARYRNPRKVDYPLVREVKERLFRQAWERFERSGEQMRASKQTAPLSRHSGRSCGRTGHGSATAVSSRRSRSAMAASPGQNGKPVQQCETPKHWRA